MTSCFVDTRTHADRLFDLVGEETKLLALQFQWKIAGIAVVRVNVFQERGINPGVKLSADGAAFIIYPVTKNSISRLLLRNRKIAQIDWLYLVSFEQILGEILLRH